MSRVIRFLTVKALWLYGFAILLPYIYFLLLAISAPAVSQTENIFYPAVVTASTFGYIALFTLGLLLISIILHACKSRSVVKWLGLAIFVITLVTLTFALMGPATGNILIHEDSEWLYGATYHLAANPYSTPFPFQEHTLFECDLMGLRCRVVESGIRSRWGTVTLNLGDDGLELVELSGEVAYTYRP